MKIKKQKESGFTLIELLVVIALMTIIMTLTLSDYAGMNKKIELENTVYSTALAVRESQFYGINKKLKDLTNLPAGDDGFTDKSFYPYGIHIDISSGPTRELIIFEDRNPIDANLDGNCTTNILECTRIVKLNREKIDKIRVENNSGSWQDFHGKINILFKRPDPDARIVDNDNKNNVYSRVRIQISSKNDRYKGCVEIGSAGDINLSSEECK